MTPPILISIVLPFYNEQGCAEGVLRDLHTTLQGSGLRFEIVAVQNGSRDRTGTILRSLCRELEELRVVEVEANRGFGFGVLQGLSACDGGVLGYMPGDGQIASAAVPRLIELLCGNGLDLVQGRRSHRQDGWLRWLISRTYHAVARMLFELPSDDLNGHPKLMRRELYTALRLCSRDHFLDAELMLKAHRAGARMGKIDVEFLPRTTGRSKVRLGACFEFLWNLIRMRWMPDDPWGLHALPRNLLRRENPPRRATTTQP